MEQFAVIIPDRNDRPEFTEHCFRQLDRMILKPAEIIHVNYSPIDEGIDLVERLHYGVMAAQSKEIDLVFVIENDDYYPSDYFLRFGDLDADFFGDDLTYYYNIRNRTYKPIKHENRASLFTTGFRISKLGEFQFKGDQFIDIQLWKYANNRGLRRRFVNSGAVGIKHGLGLCGGRGHVMKLNQSDDQMKWLRSKVDSESYRFYSETIPAILEND